MTEDEWNAIVVANDRKHRKEEEEKKAKLAE